MWKTYSAVGQGISHQQSELVCQDRTFILENEIFSIAALADGAGSYAHSEEGAELITQKICDWLVVNYNEIFEDETLAIEKIENYIISQLTEYATNKGYELDDLSSTLLVVAIDKQNKTFMAIHIGDGVIGISRENELLLLSDSQNGDSPNMTFMTTSEPLSQYIRIQYGQLTDDISGFMLLSDGGAHVLFAHKTKVFTMNANKIMNHSISGQMNKELIESFTVDFLVPKCLVFDDCSIAILARDNANDVSVDEIS